MISLNIFTKCPNTGNPKTRMSMLLDKKGRSSLSQEMLLCILSEIKDMNANIKKCLWVYPDYNDPWIESLSKEYELILNKQVGKTLSSRIIQCLLMESKYSEKTILIGSDIPSLTKETIMESIAILDNNDVVLGPSYDGGFYLIGIKDNRLCKHLLNQNRLKSFLDLKDYFESIEKKVGLLDKHKDIDNPEDLLLI